METNYNLVRNSRRTALCSTRGGVLDLFLRLVYVFPTGEILKAETNTIWCRVHKVPQTKTWFGALPFGAPSVTDNNKMDTVSGHGRGQSAYLMDLCELSRGIELLRYARTKPFGICRC